MKQPLEVEATKKKAQSGVILLDPEELHATARVGWAAAVGPGESADRCSTAKSDYNRRHWGEKGGRRCPSKCVW